MIVIFLGTIVYPITYEQARRKSIAMTPMTVIKEVEKEVEVDQIPTPVTVTPVEEVVVTTEPTESPVETVEVSESEAFVPFTRDLRKGDRGEDVKRLQEYLNARGFIVAESGVGSPGNETQLFGVNTELALKKFQEANAEVLLAPYGLTTGTGFLGEATRALINS